VFVLFSKKKEKDLKAKKQKLVIWRFEPTQPHKGYVRVNQEAGRRIEESQDV